MPPAQRLIEVALPLPLFQTFTYAVEDGLANPVEVGTRVVVPFRNKREIGICLGPSDGAGLKGAARAVLETPDAEPALSPELLALCRWIADYYVVPMGVALRCALPAALTGAAAPTPAQKTQRVVSLRRHVESLLHRERIFGRAPQQRALYELVESLGGRAAVETLQEAMPFSPSVLKGLVARGLVTVEDEVVARDPFASRATAPHKPVRPTEAQRAAIDAVREAGPGETFLLHGVTGSGKTLVYIEIIREIVERRGESAIVLVPEIALTPQTVDRFRAVFGDRIAVLHSALSDGERYDAWLALKRGERTIAVGARSAIFAPVQNLGAIIVDEEHESSYKQGETPRYHARETAIVRARQEGAVVVLGSATPSLESWVNAQSGKFRLLELPSRVGGGRLPEVDVVDLRRGGEGGGPTPGIDGVARVSPEAARALLASRHGTAAGSQGYATPAGGQGWALQGAIRAPFEAGRPRRAPGAPNGSAAPGGPPPMGQSSASDPDDRHHDLARMTAAALLASPAAPAYRATISAPLDAALADRMVRGEQSILLLNRRGYASFVQCGDCGDVATCPNCSITLTYHRTPERLVCHYCLHKEATRPQCVRCGGETMRQRGLGTQQVERLLAERFPRARIARMDVDTTSGKWAHAEILDRVGRGEVDVLLGTQMIAKGLDFPNVTLVGVIDADVGINLPDFRASERCFQLLSQVAGRAGRGPKGGRVLIQTRVPAHHAVRCALAHDYHAFVREEIAGREKPAYPPMVRIANVVFSGAVEGATARLAEQGADWLKRLLAGRPDSGIVLIGPAPCPIERIKNRWRWHVLLKAEHPGELTRVGRYFLERFEVPKTAQLRVILDRDPVALL